MAEPAVSRHQVLAFRIRAQQLDRPDVGGLPLAVLDIGVQESGSNADLTAVARTRDLSGWPSAASRPGGPAPDGGSALLAWTLRGAPHWHRRADLGWLPAALWPVSDDDAIARMLRGGRTLKQAGHAGLEAFATAVKAMRAAVPRATAKGAVSTAMSAALPAAFLSDCRPCQTRHVPDGLFRLASLPAGLLLEPDTSPPVLYRAPGRWSGPPRATGDVQALVRAYLALLGPGTPGDVAGYLGMRAADVKQRWPDDVAPVTVDRRKAFVLDAHLDALRSAELPDSPTVRLLGPYDPWLQARDRDLIVPDAALQKQLWPVLGRPNSVFADGEVAGSWRTRAKGRRLEVTFQGPRRLTKRVRTELDDELAAVGRLRGASEVTLTDAS